MSEKENDTSNEQEQPPQPSEAEAVSAAVVEDAPAVYPLRPASEDPRWALWIVYIWTGIAVFLFLFLSTLLILGFWYD